MNNLEDLLASALSCYRDVLQAYNELEGAGFGADGKVLGRMVEKMAPKLAAARESDCALLGYLDGTGSSHQYLPMMREYRDLLGQVAECNQVLLGRARTHCALVSAEISELRAGKTALAGYRLPPGERGNSVSEIY